MSFITIDVTPNAQLSRDFGVIIKQGKRTLATWSVSSEEEGRGQILAAIEEMNKKYNPDVI